MPRDLMRRQVPRTSPNCTREFGPIDATSRDDLLGPARTTTHSRAIELTHRELEARDFAVRAFVGAVTFGAGAVIRGAGFSSATVVGVGIGSGLSFEATLGGVVAVA